MDFVRNLTCQTGKATSKPDEQYWRKSANIVSLVESDNFRQSVYRMVSCLYASDSTNKLFGLERKKYRIYNILDLNIVPVNVHALQREIPFINLFNYSYTFDHMIKNFLGVSLQSKQTQDIHGNIPVTMGENPVDDCDDPAFDDKEYKATWHPEDSLVRHLMYPLGFRRLREYVNNTYRLMSGNTSLVLNKPKYLSDQLWNKVLLNSIYNSQMDESPANRDLNEARRAQILSSNRILPGSMGQRRRGVQIGGEGVVDDMSEPMLKSINMSRNSSGSVNSAVALSLSYMNKNGFNEVVKGTEANANVLNKLGYEGYLRYNSKLVRWVEWFVQLQRTVRLLMRDQLEWMGDVVVRDTDAVAEEVTEYKNNNIFDIEDYN